jgi:hypothetical protein
MVSLVRSNNLKSPLILLPLIFFVLALSLLTFWKHENLHQITGDEPHYLVMADGLLPTFELEQTGPYSREFRNRTISPYGLAPRDAVPTIENTHSVAGPHGLFNIHNLGLPIILSIPYLLGGAIGARLALIAIGAAVVALLTVIARSLGASNKQIFLFVGPLTLGMPFVPASTQIYPDLPAGLLLLLGLTLLAVPRLGRKPFVLLFVSMGLALMPWIHLKFSVPMAIVLCALFIEYRKYSEKLKLSLTLLLPTLFSVCLLLSYNKYAFDNFLGPYESKDVQATSFTILQFFGLLTDQNQGILIQQPLHLIGILMIGRVIREKTNLIVTALLLTFSTLGINATHWALYGGFSFGGRFNWTATVCFAVVTIVSLLQLSKTSRRFLITSIVVASIIQFRYLFGLIFESKDLLARPLENWVGTYSVFWPQIETALPRWNFTADAFEYFPNIVSIVLISLIFLVGLLPNFEIQKRLGISIAILSTSIVAVSIFAVRWNPELGLQRWNGDFLPGQVGQVEAPARTVSEPSPAGYLTFGPRWQTPVGRYKVTIQYQGDSGSSSPVGQLDIFSPSSEKVLKKADLLTSPEGRELSLYIEVTKEDAGRLEFRTFYNGEGTLTTSWIQIEPA